jgi:hypothetical protein
MKVLKIVGWVTMGITAISALCLALGFPVMWLWNWLMPAIFGLPVVTFWQAVGLLVLSHLLLKGHHPGHRHHGGRDHSRWQGFAKHVRCAMGTENQTQTGSNPG